MRSRDEHGLLVRLIQLGDESTRCNLNEGNNETDSDKKEFLAKKLDCAPHADTAARHSVLLQSNLAFIVHDNRRGVNLVNGYNKNG